MILITYLVSNIVRNNGISFLEIYFPIDCVFIRSGVENVGLNLTVQDAMIQDLYFNIS